MDTQKESFRRYLEISGVVDTLTKVLVSLYEEPDKPKQAVDYIKAVLGGPTPAEHDALRAEREALRAELEEARRTVADLKARLNALESRRP
ncbi:MAG: hypothetical protein J3K34DRAFT_474477 [Monoraphidium minutum]|nr:MAG: hypothetical protein J3K34DRAFT_474477 [Monoraphidium minutum]